jgi:hypothetical protein
MLRRKSYEYDPRRLFFPTNDANIKGTSSRVRKSSPWHSKLLSGDFRPSSSLLFSRSSKRDFFWNFNILVWNLSFTICHVHRNNISWGCFGRNIWSVTDHRVGFRTKNWRQRKALSVENPMASSTRSKIFSTDNLRKYFGKRPNRL